MKVGFMTLEPIAKDGECLKSMLGEKQTNKQKLLQHFAFVHLMITGKIKSAIYDAWQISSQMVLAVFRGC